ncbi:MAG: glycosyltransferase family 4 protein [Acidobacteriia bacterium]|nr:glycosyltransferase family 4 protein [Terriglobia bacterium]
MRFAVDAHAIGRHLTGNEVYIRSLLGAFAGQRLGCEFLAYVSSEGARGFVPAAIRARGIAANPFLRLGLDLPMRLRQDRPDLLHVQYTAPPACPVPIVVTVHDVSFLEYPEFFPASRAWQLRCTVKHTVRRAARVLTVSEFSKRAILRAYPELDERRVVVAPNAAGSEFRPISRQTAAAAVRQRFSISGPFVLCVGDLQPRKNHIGLVRAFSALVRAYPQLKHKLVLAGKETWYSDHIREAARRSDAAERIRFLGFVSDPDLLQLYNACDLFVFPSFYEGFGLPALEAMACGRAVACSDASALPEVVDSAAILFDPRSDEEMTRAMADLLLDAELRTRMERLGAMRAAQYSWQNTARKTLDVYYEVARGRQCATERVGSPSAALR